MAEKTIYGQAWISGNSLVQDQIKITTNGISETTEVLIDNIWNDLTETDPSPDHHYQVGGSKNPDIPNNYFFWEVEMTCIDDDDETVLVKIECPKPKPGLFQEPYNPDNVSGPYAKYWVQKLQEAQEREENEYAIQRKAVIFSGYPPGWYTLKVENGNVDSDLTEVPDYEFINSDLGDISNLLSLF